MCSTSSTLIIICGGAGAGGVQKGVEHAGPQQALRPDDRRPLLVGGAHLHFDPPREPLVDTLLQRLTLIVHVDTLHREPSDVRVDVPTVLSVDTR